MNYTPGPWRIVERKCLRGNVIGHEVRGRNTNSRSGENILFVSPDSSTPEALGNAHLISAAPEMLAALKMAWSKLHVAESTKYDTIFMNDVASVIAKAEGRC